MADGPIYTTPQAYLEQRRENDPQVDMRQLLTAFQQLKQPQTAYAGLDADEVARSHSGVINALQSQAQMLQRAQQAGVAQEQQNYADAQNAHKMYLADRDQRLSEALKGLQMQHLRQQMGHAALANALKQEEIQRQRAFNEFTDKTYINVEGFPEPVRLSDLLRAGWKPNQRQTAAQAKAAANAASFSHPDLSEADKEALSRTGMSNISFNTAVDKAIGKKDDYDSPEDYEKAGLTTASRFAPGLSEAGARAVRGLAPLQIQEAPTAPLVDDSIIDSLVQMFKSKYSKKSN